MRSSLAQGVTTELVGNCGTSIGLVTAEENFAQERRWAERGGTVLDWSRMSEYLARVEDGGIGLQCRHAGGARDDPQGRPGL